MALMTRKALLLAKIESTYGTDPTPVGANAILVRNLSINPMNANLVGRDSVRPYYGNSEQIPVNASVECSFEVELAGSGSTSGAEPAWGVLLKGCGFGVDTLATAQTGTLAGAAGGTATLAAGASAVDDDYNGMALRITSGTGSGQVRTIVDYVGSSKVATISDAWGTIPTGASYSVDAQASYRPASASLSSVAFYYNLDGVLHKVLGARGNVSLSLNAAGLPVMQFRYQGIYATPTDTAQVTPDFSSFRTPLPVNIPNTPNFRLHGVASPLASLSVDMGNALAFRSLPGGTEQVILTDRRPSGSISFEAATIATKDWFTQAKNATTAALTLVHGTVAGDIVQIEAQKTQITNPQYADSDGIAMLNCGLVMVPTSVGNDEIFVITR